jgi:hypothetical protein
MGSHMPIHSLRRCSNTAYRYVIDMECSLKGSTAPIKGSGMVYTLTSGRISFFWLGGQLKFCIVYIHAQFNTTIYIGIQQILHKNQPKGSSELHCPPSQSSKTNEPARKTTIKLQCKLLILIDNDGHEKMFHVEDFVGLYPA